jgi:hypothetical protein
MTAKTCFAEADTPRAVLALAVPPAAIACVVIMLVSKGYGVLDYFALLQSGELSWVRQGIGWIAILFWVARYYPSAWSAVWEGPCLVRGDDAEIILHGERRIRRTEIKAVRLQRGWFRKVAEFETSAGRVSLPLIFVRRSSDHALRSVASSD